jgi:hypothetical protein
VNKPRWDVDTPELVNEQVPDRPVNVAARVVTNTARNCARSVEEYTLSAVFERGLRMRFERSTLNLGGTDLFAPVAGRPNAQRTKTSVLRVASDVRATVKR